MSEIPPFLLCNCYTGQPVGTADCNSTALDIKDASWEDHHRVAAWAMPGVCMVDCMPVRYSGVRIASKIEVEAVQQTMFSETRMVGVVQTRVQDRQWWVALPPGALQKVAGVCIQL